MVEKIRAEREAHERQMSQVGLSEVREGAARWSVFWSGAGWCRAAWCGVACGAEWVLRRWYWGAGWHREELQGTVRCDREESSLGRAAAAAVERRQVQQRVGVQQKNEAHLCQPLGSCYGTTVTAALTREVR